MNIFGKNKHPPQVPPAPLKRPEKLEQVAAGDAEEEDDQYTYEVPPSEGQNKKVVPVKWQEATESVYLDNLVIRRFSEPNNVLQEPRPRTFLSKPGADDGSDEEMVPFVSRERALNTGMMKSPLPPPLLPPSLPLSTRRVSLPVLGPPGSPAHVNRDPFLAMKDEKEECPGESIYIQCEPNTASSVPCRMLPIPAPPARPVKQPKPKVSTPGLQQADSHNLLLTKPVSSYQVPAGNPSEGRCLKSGPLAENSGLQNETWYAGNCDRHTAETALLRFNKDSAYMVRQSSGQGWNQPFTLAVLFKNRVYNIPIRYLESSHQYALGKDGKTNEELFDSISSIIQNYTEQPLVLIDGNTSTKEQTCLLFPVKP